MKKSVLTYLSLLVIYSVSAQFPIGNRTITYTDPDRGGRSVETVFYYPATAAGSNQPFANGQFPLIVFGHGFSMGQDAYGNYVDALVPLGYILAFPTTEGGLSPSHANFGGDLEFLIRKIKSEGANNSASFLYGRVGATSAIMGHSMGGGASFLAAANNANITTLVNFAAAETTPSAIAAAANVQVPTLMFAGTHDGVTPPADHQIPMYNALAASCKTLIRIVGGGHCYFANPNTACSLGETFTSPQPTITRAQQHSVINAFLIPYLNFMLKGDQAQRQVFQDSLTTSTRITYLQSCGTTDAALMQIVQPGNVCGLSANEPLTVRIQNLGGNTINSFDVSYSVNGSPVVTETVNATLYTGQHIDHTFAQTINMFQPGQYNITSTVTVTGDQQPANNTKTKSLTNSSVLLPQSVDFTGFTGANLSTVFPNWREAQGIVPTGTTSMWSNRVGLGTPTNVTARINFFSSPTREWIIGPVFFATQYTQLTFDAALTGYNNFNAYPSGMPSVDAVIVKISTDCGSTWTDLFTINNSNKPTNALTPYTVDLSAFNGQAIIIAFYASRTSTSSADYDFHLDNILIKDYPPIDAEIISLVSPDAANECYGNNETVVVKVRNNGLNTIHFSSNPLTITGSITGPTGTQNISTIINTGQLAALSETNVTVATGINMSQSGTYYYQFNISMPNDGNLNNNQFSTERINTALPVTITGPTSLCNGNSATLGISIQQMTPGPVTTLINNTSGSIPDNNTTGISRTITVTDASQLTAPEIISVKVNITHTFTGDLILKLTAPNGSSIILSNRRGGSGDNYTNTEFRMDAVTPIADGIPPFSYSYLPDEPFTNLSGPANGNWVFNVSDRAAGDVGTLQNWSITFRQDNQIVSYLWSTNETTPTITVTPLQTQIYHLTITDAKGCQSYDEHEIIVLNQTPLSLGNDTTLCQGQSVTFNVGQGNSSILWHNNSNAQTYTSSTTETVYVQVVNVCGTFSDTVQVVVVPLPNVQLGNDTTLCTGQTLVLNAGAGYSSYLWSTGAQTSTVTLNSDVPSTTTYSVTVTDTNGCQGNDAIQVTYEICTMIHELNHVLFAMWPNPVSDYIEIHAANTLWSECIVMDISGKIIDKFLIKGSLVYDMSSLPQGIYVFAFTHNKKIIHREMIIKQ